MGYNVLPFASVSAAMQAPRQAKPWPAARFLTITEVAQTCGVSRNTVGKWIASGLLTVVRLGKRCVRVRREAFETMLKKAST